MRYGLKLGIILSFLLSTAWAAETIQWEAQIQGKKLMDITLDEKGSIRGILFGEKGPLSTEYYFVSQDYTCGQDLKANFHADCKNTCFPSYNQKGIDFSVALAPDAKYACYHNVENTQFQGFKAQRHIIECAGGKVEYVVVPQFKKYQAFLNAGTNNYFKQNVQEFKLDGLVTQVRLKEHGVFMWKPFYEAKKMKLSAKAPPVALPEGYKVISPEPFIEKMSKVDKEIADESQKKMEALLKEKNTQVSLRLAEVKKGCQTRFPAVENDVLLMELCRSDSNVKSELERTVAPWFGNIQNQIQMGATHKLQESIKLLLESTCK